MLLNLDSFGPFVRQYVIVIAVNLPILGSGLGFAWSSPMLVKLNEEDNPVLGRPLTENEASWIVSVFIISSFMSNFLASYLVDRIGRKYCLLLSTIPRILAYILLNFATNVKMLIFGRIAVGMADGFTFSIIPMYTAEVASKEIRGALGMFFQIFSSIGVVIMLAIGPFLSYYEMSKIVLYIIVARAVPLIFIPDSPFFLYQKGKTEEATKVLTFLKASKSVALKELKEYEEASKSAEKSMTLKEAMRSKIILKSIIINVCLGFGAQATGFNAVAFYLQTILVSTNTNVSPGLASAVIGAIQLFASLCTIFIIDRFGRRPILLTTMVGVVAGMVGLGTFFHVSDSGDALVAFMNYLPLISLVLVSFCYSSGIGALLYPLMSELFEGTSRAIGVMFGMCSNYAGIMLITKTFGPLTSAIGPAITYWIFGLTSFIYTVFILFCIPETKGRTFTEIQAKLEGKRVDGISTEIVIKQ